MNKPENNRVNQAALRERMKEQGLVRREFWLRPEHYQLIKVFIESLLKIEEK